MPITPTILSPQPVTAVVALEPVYNLLVSISALSGNEELSGLNEWVTATSASLSPVVKQRNDLIMFGIGLEALSNVVERGAATEDFPTYLAALAAYEPVALRDRLLYWAIHSPNWRTFFDSILLPEPDVSAVLADPEKGIRFFEERSREKFDRSIMAELFTWLQDPPGLQAMVVEHLGQLWESALAEEWQRERPLLQEAVDAFATVNLAGLTILEAIQVVTGRDLRTLFRLEAMLRYRHIRFVPVIHNGPYISWFGDDAELRMTFMARRPHHTPGQLSPLDRSELSNRLAALADETRLQILYTLRQEGELSTQELIDRFDLNKSAASRHLRQLFANNLIQERREDGAKKVYMINQQTIEETLRLLRVLGG
jgi:DNA-binding transcriptional ArsR family regulator